MDYSMIAKACFRIIFSFLLGGICTSTLGGDAAYQSLTMQGPSTVEALNSQAIKKIRIQIGNQRSKILESTLSRKYPNYQVIDSCIGSFSKVGATDIAISTLNLKTGKEAYFSAIGGNLDKLIEIKNSNFKMGKKGFLEKPIELRCESTSSIERLKKEFELIEPSNATNFSVKQKGPLDILCVTDPEVLESFSCFSFDIAQQKFLSAGGWFND